MPAPNGGDWTQIVSRTPEGGFVMGNPNAPVKLIEYASLTCPHCADFSENGQPKLIDQYVKTGKVSYELRNFVRDPVDLAAALLSRCGGATPYFKLTDQLFAAQPDWFAQIQKIPPADQQRLQTLPPAQVTGELATKGGLVDFVKIRGIPAEKAQACLADQAEIEKLVAMNQVATQQFNLSGTPTFVINGSTARIPRTGRRWSRSSRQRSADEARVRIRPGDGRGTVRSGRRAGRGPGAARLDAERGGDAGGRLPDGQSGGGGKGWSNMAR